MRNRGSWQVVLLVTVGLAAAICGRVSATVIINEVAWGGSAASSADEWIELRNTSEQEVDLIGWTLRFGESVIHLGVVEGATIETRRTVLPAHGYLLLERTDDATISDLHGDLLYRGSLSNSGMDLILYDAEGQIVDQVLFADTGWPAGCGSDGEPPYGSMERLMVGDEVEWSTNAGRFVAGLDAAGNPICGTPGTTNEAAIVAASCPQVTWRMPDGSGPSFSGTVVLRWEAEDPDTPADQLRIRIDLSHDKGETWAVLADHLANAGSYAWDTVSLENGEDYCLRIAVTDPAGFEGSAVSEAFAVTNP